MKQFKWALGALAFACMAVGSQAATVEVVVDVTATSKWQLQWDEGDTVHIPDTSFQPVSFTMSWRFELGQPFAHGFSWNSAHAEQSRSEFSLADTASTDTPFSPALQLAGREGGVAQDLSEVIFTRALTAPSADLDLVLPSTDGLTLMTAESWQSSEPVGDGPHTQLSYLRAIDFVRAGNPLSAHQLGVPSGEDALALLRAQVGVLLPGAYYETNWVAENRLTNGFPTELVSAGGFVYRGDAVIRSVSEVPEPGNLVLSLVGVALVALRAGGGRHVEGRRRA